MTRLAYIFVMEIPYFSIEAYDQYASGGEVTDQKLGVYTRPGSGLFYLFDKIINKLYAFSPVDMAKGIVEKDVYLAYYLNYPENQLASIFSSLEK